MSSAGEKREFHVADYVVFSLSLGVCCLMGVVTAIMGCRKKTSAEDSMTGGKSMSIFPVSMSVLASFLAAPFVLGTPAEMYFFGTQYALVVIGFGMATPVVAHVFIPLFHKLNVVNGYEYLERRFNNKVRLAGSITFALMMLLYMAVVVYAPALAFSQVTSLPLEITVLVVGLTCTFYTAVGGLKAVIWVDVVQMLIILAGLIALTIKGLIDVGGFEKVWTTSMEGGRIQFNNISPHPHERHTVWTMTLGAAFTTLVLIGTNQAIIQKYLSIPKLSHAQVTPYIAWGLLTLYMLLVCFVGLVMYTYYADCDPLRTGKVSALDQLIPLFVMDVLGPLYGIPGLFTAAVFSATLSTVAAGVNALAAITYVDAFVPIYKHCGKTMTPRLTTIVTKVLTVFYGCVTIGIAYLAPLLGKALLQISISIFGVAGGPLLGLFIVGMFFPFVNTIGAVTGLIVSLAFSFWIAIGAIATNVPATSLTWLPLNTSCPSTNITESDVTQTWITTTESMMDMTTMDSPPAYPTGGVHELYRISYIWYTMLAVIIVVVVGILVSLLTCRRRNLPPLAPGLIVRCSCKDDDDEEAQESSIVKESEQANGQYPTKGLNGKVNEAYVSDGNSKSTLYPNINGYSNDFTKL